MSTLYKGLGPACVATIPGTGIAYITYEFMLLSLIYSLGTLVPDIVYDNFADFGRANFETPKIQTMYEKIYSMLHPSILSYFMLIFHVFRNSSKLNFPKIK